MKPLIAAFSAGLLILFVCLLDRHRGRPISKAAWIPLAWLLIGSSRPLTSWFISLQQGANYEDGSPLDRTVLTILLALGLFVLSKRMRSVKPVLRANLPIIFFFLYCLASIVWSDFPFITFKRWTRGIGDIVMILIIVTDPHWEAVLKWILRRIAFLLIPLSVLLVRFFPEYGRNYSFGGAPMWTGVCTDKNALGTLCMIFGTALLWQMLPLSTHRPTKLLHRRERIAMGIVLAIALYLIANIDSKTALMCLVLASTLIIITLLRQRFRRPGLLTAIVAGMIISCYCVLFLGIGTSALETLGRKSDLTGRTEIWAAVLPLATNPWLGTGYEDFWMGDRFLAVQRAVGAPLNEAHNGYIEIYLNLGWMGLALLGIIIVAGYRNIMKGLRANPNVTRLKLAFFLICLVYNFTEATFKMNSPIWIFFLWGVMAVPKLSVRSKFGLAPRNSKLVEVTMNETPLSFPNPTRAW